MKNLTKKLTVSCLSMACVFSMLSAVSVMKKADAAETLTKWNLNEYYKTVEGVTGPYKTVIGFGSDINTVRNMAWDEASKQHIDGDCYCVKHKDGECIHADPSFKHSFPDGEGVHVQPGDKKMVGFEFVAPYSGNFTVTFNLTWSFHTLGPDYGGCVVDGVPNEGFGGATANITSKIDGEFKELLSNDYGFADLTGEGNQWKTMTASAVLNKGDSLYMLVDSDNQADPNDKFWWDNYVVDMDVERTAMNAGDYFPTEIKGENNLYAMWAGENSFDKLSTENVTYIPDQFIYKGGLDWARISKDNLMPDRGVSAVMYKAPATAKYKVTYTYKWDSTPENRGGNGAKLGIGTWKDRVVARVGDEDVKSVEDLVEPNNGASKEFTMVREVELKYGEGVFVYVDSNGDGGWDNYIYKMYVETITEAVPEVNEVVIPEGASNIIGVGDKLQLSAKVSGASTTLVEWSASNDVVTVDKNGLVTAIKSGNSTITAKIGDSFKTFDVQVASSDLKAEIKCENSAVQERKTLNLSANVTMKGVAVEGAELTWTSSNEAIATVKDGVVTGIKEGTTTIRLVAVHDGATAIVEKEITVTAGVKVTIAGKTIVFVDGEETTLTVETENTTETAVVWKSETPEVISITENGVIKGLKYGYGVVSATVDGTTAYYAVVVKKEYPTTGRVWDFYKDFPMEAGDNGFTVVYGPTGKVEEDPSYLAVLNGMECVRSTDVPEGAPQQWKGGSTYATLAQPFIMPGDGAMGFRFKAPADGTYRVNLSFEWSMGARAQLPTLEMANEKSFDGVVVGLAVIDADDNVQVVMSKMMDYTTLTSVATEKLLGEYNIEMKKDQDILFFVDNNGNGGYDQYDYTATIANEKYEEVPEVDATPVVTNKNFVFDRADAKDVVIEIDTKGKNIVELKMLKDVIDAKEYSYVDGKLTIKKEWLEKQVNGLKPIMIITEGGSCDIRINIKGEVEETKTEKGGCGSSISMIASGVGMLACGAYAVLNLLKKRR